VFVHKLLVSKKIPCYFQVRNNQFLCNRPDGPLKASERPSHTVQTLGQATPSSTRIWILEDTNWEGFAERPDDVATRPDATQCSRIFRVFFTDAKMSDSIDCPDTRSSRSDAVLFWEELCHSGKGVAKDDATTCHSMNLIKIRFSVSL
jgi:hypothetical protein